MGIFHIVDLVVLAVIGLAIFGPKTLQSMARNAGKGLSQAKMAKDKLMTDLPLEELSNISQNVPRSPQQAIQMLMTPEKEAKEE